MRYEKTNPSTRRRRLALSLVLTLCFTLLLAACSKDETEPSGDAISPAPEWNYVTIEMKDDLGSFVIELEPEEAPLTVENFRKLVHEGFYDGLTFHRIVPGFVLQGGDPRGDGTGGSADLIKGEFAENGVENTLVHQRGTVSMARSADFDSASSQFYVVLSNNNVSHLDGAYAAFGQVISGMEVVDQIVEDYLSGQGETPTMDKVTLAETNPAG